MILHHIECTTADGRLISLSCLPEAEEEVRAAFAKVRSLAVPMTHQTNVCQGGYGRYSRFDITQHKYGGGGYPGCGGYVEALEIANPPDERCGFVLHEFVDDCYRNGSKFWEFDSLANLLAVWPKLSVLREANTTVTGLLRSVACGGLTPWFYAIGNQALFGDFAYPNHVGNDPIYRPFQRFVVYSQDGFPTVKTCMGCQVVTRDVFTTSYSTAKRQFRVVYWDDGTVYDEQQTYSTQPPRPLDERDVFAQVAVDQFREGLSGQRKHFTIHLTDGTRFTGSFSHPGRGKKTTSGHYFARAMKRDGTEVSGTFDFEPTVGCPTVEQFLNQHGFPQILELKYRYSFGRKKRWAGVFPAPTSAPQATTV